MASFETHIYDYLLQNQLLALEGIGVFYVTQDKSFPNISRLQVVYQHDKKTATTPAFINYVAEKEGKNKLLIASDIQSYLIEAKQLINIGRPFIIKGLGFIQLGKTGQYQFVEQSVSELKEPEQVKSKSATEPQGAYVASDNKSSQKNRLGIVVFVILFILAGGIAWSVYYFFTQKQASANDNTALISADTVHSNIDTVKAVTTDSIVKKPLDSSSSASISNSSNYRFIFERTFNRDRAFKRYNQLVGFDVQVYIDSSVVPITGLFKLYVLRHIPNAADTLIKKDSLSRYFGKEVFIQAEK